MNQQERNATIKRLIRNYTAKDTRSPAEARAALIRESIYSQEGELMPEFGGPSKNTESPEHR